jgi:hypothetical protein
VKTVVFFLTVKLLTIFGFPEQDTCRSIVPLQVRHGAGVHYWPGCVVGSSPSWGKVYDCGRLAWFSIAIRNMLLIPVSFAFTVGNSFKFSSSRLKDEWGLAATNVLTMAVCNAATVWCLSPSRSYGQTFKFDWQNALQKLPNHCFDASYPLREFTKKQRALTFIYKSLELGLIGVMAGTASAGLAKTIPHSEE